MQNIILVGCGKMGNILLKGLLKSENKFNITIVSPNNNAFIQQISEENIQVITKIDDYKETAPDVIIFAVKPQKIPEIINEYKKFTNKKILFVSILAGKSIEYFSKNLGKNEAISRIMPNTPISTGLGVSGGYRNEFLDKSQIDFIEKLFLSFGKFIWLDQESQIDAISAISGSGPAYLFHFIESLTYASVELGLPKEISEMIAIETVFGSAQMAREGKHTIKELRDQVTSPQGTTEAALKILMKELNDLILRTAKEAKKRSEELSH